MLSGSDFKVKTFKKLAVISHFLCKNTSFSFKRINNKIKVLYL